MDYSHNSHIYTKRLMTLRPRAHSRAMCTEQEEDTQSPYGSILCAAIWCLSTATHYGVMSVIEWSMPTFSFCENQRLLLVQYYDFIQL